MPPRHKWVRPLRLTFAFVLTPAVMLVWFCLSLDGAMALCGMDPDGPALVMLGMLLFGPLMAALLLGVALWLFYLVAVLGEHRLSFPGVMLPTGLLALTHGLLMYLSLRPWGDSSFAPVMGLLSTSGVIASGLYFYFVGVWRMVMRQGGDSLPRAVEGGQQIP